MSEYVTVWVQRPAEEEFVREEIVRCRDCKLSVAKGHRLYCDLNAGGFPNVEPDGFCAWGERRDS